MIDWISAVVGAAVGALAVLAVAGVLRRRRRPHEDLPISNVVPTAPGDEKFDELVVSARAIKEQLVDRHREWYRRHTTAPFIWFRTTGIVTILLSVGLPVVAALRQETLLGLDKAVVLTSMSLGIAALTSLGAFFRWERSWHSRNSAKFSIDALVAKWELEIQNARLLVKPEERVGHVYRATSDLLTNFRAIGADEAEQFFSGLRFPQADTTRSPK